MRKMFAPLAGLTAVVLGFAVWLIANAPYESSMLLIQKIFYFHVASWVAMYCGIVVSSTSRSSALQYEAVPPAST